MKKLLYIILAALAAASCVQERFEPSYALGVTMKTLTVGKSGGVKHIIVYSNSEWQAQLDSARSWCELRTTSGEKTGEVQIYFRRNRGFERNVKLILTSGEQMREIAITQSAGITSPYARFAEETVTVNNLEGCDSVRIITNIGDEIPEYGSFTVTYEPEGENWLSLSPVEPSTAEDSTLLRFSFLPNASGADRVAHVTLKVKVESGNDLEAKFDVSQFSRPEIKFTDTPVLVFAESVDVPFSANFEKYIDILHPLVLENCTYDAPYTDWISSAAVDGNKLSFTFKPLTILSEVTRSAKVNLSYTDQAGQKYSFVYSLVQKPIEIKDLSANGTANCYIADSSGYFKFNAAVRGNGVIPDGSSYTSAAIEGGVSAKVLWETVNTSSAPDAGSIINNVVYSDGLVCFNCQGRDGNACIALLDADGEILWSWHIWAAMGYDPAQHECSLTTNTTYFKPSQVLWMDRNIGALSDGSNKDTRYLSVGFFFQQSRKDPMLGSANYVSEHAKVNTSTNFMKTTNNDLWSVSDTAWTEKEIVKHPTVYTKGTGVFSDQAFNSRLWGALKVAPSTKGPQALDITAVKTLHDPCPVGYQVPAAWHYYSCTGGKIQDCADDGFRVVEDSDDKMWFPAGGLRNADNISFNKSKKGTGYYHLAVSSKGTSARQIHYFGTTSSVYNLSYSNSTPNGGRTVRCVKENQTAEML